MGGALAALALAAPAWGDSREPIDGYRVTATPGTLETLAQAGFDVTEGREGRSIEIFGSAAQIAKLRAQGMEADRIGPGQARAARRGRRGRARAAQEGAASDAAYKVWRRYDRVGGDDKEQYLELYDRLAKQYPRLVKRSVIGRSVQGRDIVALKLTRNARTTRDNVRPAVLYNALQHAREWLAGETCRRTLLYFAENYGKDAAVTRLLDTRELWFSCVSNPDGYEYSFTPGNRLWRKNMRDNDGDGKLGEIGDGVDPNRNFPERWGWDNEGSSPEPESETYRGTGPASEPETQAMLNLWNRVDFRFQKNDHTAAELLLWPEGWQQYTYTADQPIFEALAGTDEEPAIEGFDPDLGAELYITNGDTLDSAYHQHDILAYTPEGTEAEGEGLTGFEFPDDEAQIEAEFQRHRPFSLDLARSARDPDDPESHLGNDVEDFYVDEFAESYGDPQTVEVNAKRAVGDVTLRYSINDGAVRSASTREFQGGERYKRDDQVYFHRLRGQVTGTDPGDRVEVWFEAADGRAESEHFTYEARSESTDPVLVMAAEDYTGPVPDQAGGPNHLDYYRDALDANGIGNDLYDVDARGRRAPHPLGVLAHYEAVIWYTGDDYVTRRPGQPGGTGTDRLALDEQVAVRDYLNEGGKLFFTGKNAGRQYAEGYEFRNVGYPQGDEPEGRYCSPREPESVDRCIAHSNDFLQYWLGAYSYLSDAGTDPATGSPFPMRGEGPPFGELTWSFNGEDTPGNQDHTATFLPTSTILPPEQFPQFASRRVATWDRPGGSPYEPVTGDWFASAGYDNAAYKRLTREIDLTGKTSGELTFQASYDLEPSYDFLFVEAHAVGEDDWTTLPDLNGNTSQAPGESCTFIQDDNPFLGRYVTAAATTEGCRPTGTSGEWNAASGNSGGWKEWRIDLSRYAGKKVELSIAVATDPAVEGLGAWVDDARVTADGETLAETSFEEDLGGWTAAPAPEGTRNATPQWARSDEALIEGGLIATEDTLYAGFGFEGIAGEETRAAFMRGVLAHLGVLPPE